MNRRRITVVIAAASAAATLAACSSSTSGTPTGAGSSGGSSGRSSSGSAAAGTPSPSAASTPAAANPEALALTLRRGLASTRSAHISLHITTAGQSITGQGDETLAAGKLRGVDLTETIPGVGSLRLIELGGKTYAKLPASLNTKSSKPWVLVSTTSSNTTIRALAQGLQASQSSGLDSATAFVSAAQSVANRGPATVLGVRTTHYYVVVDVTKLPATYPGRSALTAAGVRTLPINLYLDDAGRPVQLTEQITVSGKQVSTSTGITKYNRPVTISAPPASQVSIK